MTWIPVRDERGVLLCLLTAVVLLCLQLSGLWERLASVNLGRGGRKLPGFSVHESAPVPLVSTSLPVRSGHKVLLC